MSTYANLPAPSPEQGLNRYMQEIRKFPLLEPEEFRSMNTISSIPNSHGHSTFLRTTSMKCSRTGS